MKIELLKRFQWKPEWVYELNLWEYVNIKDGRRKIQPADVDIGLRDSSIIIKEYWKPLPIIETKIYSGKLHYWSNWEEDEIISLNWKYLSKLLEDDIWEKVVTVRYYASPSEINPDTVVEDFWRTYYWKLDANYWVAWSEYTWYLWTDQDLDVWWHDIQAELESHIWEYIYMIIDIH